MVSSGAITIALILSESRETKLEMTKTDGVRVQRARKLKQRRRRGQRERQNEKGLDWQNNQTLLVHHAFLYISLSSLHDYDVKVPNFTFCRGRERRTTTFFFFC